MSNIPAISDAVYQAMKVIWAADVQVVLLHLPACRKRVFGE